MDYTVNFTDLNKLPITVAEGDKDTTSTDVALFGRVRLEYGQELNEDLLHLLEHFAAPELPGSTFNVSAPDSSDGTYDGILSRPIAGQLWFNSTRTKFYYYDGLKWLPLANRGEYAANWGIIADGLAMPRPVDPVTGYVFPYSECIFSVSPSNFSGKFDYMVCTTDPATGIVNMKYRLVGSTSLTSSVANYCIIGIRGNTNHGAAVPTPSMPNVTPTPTPTRTASPTPNASQTPTQTSTHGVVTATPTPTPTPAVTITNSPTPSKSPSAGAAPSVTPSGTPTRTPTRTATRTPTRTPAPTANVTPTPSPSASNSAAAGLAATFFASTNPAQPLNNLTAFCDVADHPGAGDQGRDCSGTVQSCGAGGCAPESNDTGADVGLQMSVTGGVAPYTVKFTNWTGSYDVTGVNCFTAISGTNLVAIASNSSGIVNSTLSLTKTISASGGTLNAPVLMVGQCGNREINGVGTFQVIITDSAGTPHSRTYTLNWSISRTNSNN